MTAAGPAATASGQPRGLITAHASTASRASRETVSPMAAFNGPSLRPALMYPHQATANVAGKPEQPDRDGGDDGQGNGDGHPLQHPRAGRGGLRGEGHQ